MEIIPAIDLKNGKCVRLYQGDYSRETVFSDDPVQVALKWKSLGATRLHIIDLDGAASGKPKNFSTVEKIVQKAKIPVQLGGGIRSETTVQKVIEADVKRVIIGTIAIERPDLIKRLCSRFGEAIMVSIDAREGKVATHGWRQETEVKAIWLALEMKEYGVRRILFTDISRDGTLSGPAIESIALLVKTVKISVVAAGGIASLNDLKNLARTGAEAAVIGRALYTGDIDLAEALALE